MSSPAASAPFAALVLAWDETTPAARVDLEATDLANPAPEPIAVLVPAGPLAEAFSQEEFLLLEASFTLPELPAPPPPAAEPLAETEALPAPAATTVVIELAAPQPATAGLPAVVAAPGAEAATPPLPAAEVAAATAAALVKPALVWQEVRVLQLPHPGPAQLKLVWGGETAVPAVPYLGSAEPVPATQGALTADKSMVAAALLSATDSTAAALLALQRWAPPATGLAAPAEEMLAFSQPAYPMDELPAAADAEPDTLPIPAADASTIGLSEQAAGSAEPITANASPAQAEFTQLILPPIETLAAAASAAETSLLPVAEPATSPSLAALYPPAQAFDAPNLNFQIIQYARLAVPQALAAQPFEVIYAPAWPTWLAAQELRHRSGQPLVLHLAQLAAADDELIDLAAGWVAEIQRQALHRADLILTETQALALRLRRELALPAHRVRPVPAADAAAVAQALRTAVRG